MSIGQRVFSRSLFLFHLGGSACNNCDIEIIDALTPRYDLERFGITAVGSIRHADIILLSGIFNKKSAIRVARSGPSMRSVTTPAASARITRTATTSTIVNALVLRSLFRSLTPSGRRS